MRPRRRVGLLAGLLCLDIAAPRAAWGIDVPDPSNNTTRLVIDVIDRNDF